MSWLCFLFLWPHQNSIGRDHFASTQRFYEPIGSRFQKQTRVQIPENRSELREKETKGTQRIIFIKIQMKQNKIENTLNFEI
jgi:hypothetical protein